jgi:hypothetical protein
MASHYIPSISRTSISRNSTPVTTRSLETSLIASKTKDSSALTARQVEIMTKLDMDQGLVGIKGSRPSLEISWHRYLAVTKATSKVGEAEWEAGNKPSDAEIIGVYYGKSAYYDQAKVFQHVRLHADMVEWLGRRVDEESDEGMEVWGYFKAVYTLRDLESWLVRKQKEARSDQKGKKKEKVPGRKKSESSGKGKEKEKEDDVSSSTSPPKKKHKKLVGGRK